MAQDLKNTLNLPETAFPMRGNLVVREPARIEHWEKIDLYGKIQAKNTDGPSFILHDGPPFTNGDLHLGHALNKTLKDTILRFKWMQGYNAPYIPGWDSHGLPIEHKVSRELQETGRTDYTPLEVRQACIQFADKFRKSQCQQFKRLGVLADWENEYWTIHPEYEATELETFASFVEQDLVYRSKKPVYWSIPCATALAEAEIEYRDHKSVSIYVKLGLCDAALKTLALEAPASVLIWTTTAWTLPANMAVSVNPKIEYSAIETSNQGTIIVATALSDAVIEACGLEDAKGINTYQGSVMEKLEARHPFIDRPSPILLADYVTTDSGTGCVHTAPGHGQDDYITGINNGIEVYCPLDDNGCYVDDGRVPAELVGLSVLEDGKLSEANRGVLKIIAQNGSLIAKKTINHSYPHCWRSKTPVIFRAMDQWFIALDKGGDRQRALDALDDVNFIPSWGKSVFAQPSKIARTGASVANVPGGYQSLPSIMKMAKPLSIPM